MWDLSTWLVGRCWLRILLRLRRPFTEIFYRSLLIFSICVLFEMFFFVPFLKYKPCFWQNMRHEIKHPQAGKAPPTPHYFVSIERFYAIYSSTSFNQVNFQIKQHHGQLKTLSNRNNKACRTNLESVLQDSVEWVRYLEYCHVVRSHS